MKTLALILLSLVVTATLAGAAEPDPLLKQSFNTTCGYCTNSAELKPLKVVGNAGRRVNGGIMREVTLTFKCEQLIKCDKCKTCKERKLCRKPKACKMFTMTAEVFVENPPRATLVGSGLPGVPK